MPFNISVDTGGTFTDVVVSDETGALTIGKALTTRDRIFNGMRGAIEAAADALRAELGALSLREVRRRAEQAGVGAGRLDEALESADPKRATIELILQHRQREEKGRAGDDAALRAELGQLKLRTRPTRGRRSCACCCSARPRRSSPRRPPTSPRCRRLWPCGRSCRR